jgi:hypothetical protein
MSSLTPLRFTAENHRLEVLASQPLHPMSGFRAFAMKMSDLRGVEYNYLRFESSNLVPLEPFWNFTMHEVIFVGSKDFVL